MAHTAHTYKLLLYNRNAPLMATKSKRKERREREGGGGVVRGIED